MVHHARVRMKDFAPDARETRHLPLCPPAMPDPDAIPPSFFLKSHWQLLPAQVGDVSCIINDWCADEHVYVGRLSGEDPEIAKVGMRARILRLLGSCKCAVIRPTSAWFHLHKVPWDGAKLFGWICYSVDRSTLRPIVHFVYVKPADKTTGTGLRKHGLADALLTAAGVTPQKGAWCTHSRIRLKAPMRARCIVWNKYLLDFDPAAMPPPPKPAVKDEIAELMRW